MCIPKTNKPNDALAQESNAVSLALELAAVSFPRTFPGTLRLLAATTVVLASLVAPLQVNAAQLDTTTLTEPEIITIAAERNIAMTSAQRVDGHESGKETGLRLENGFLAANISDFATSVARAADTGTGKPRVTEFSSIGVSSMTPFGLPLQVINGTEKTPRSGAGGAAGGMSIMVLVWLFGVGLIGMGTVGRRKQSKP